MSAKRSDLAAVLDAIPTVGVREEFVVVADGVSLGVFKLDEGGVDHWVLAKDAADALVVLKDHDAIADHDRDMEAWPPTVTRLTSAQAKATTWDGQDPAVDSLLDEIKRLGAEAKRGYLGCSEY